MQFRREAAKVPRPTERHSEWVCRRHNTSIVPLPRPALRPSARQGAQRWAQTFLQSATKHSLLNDRCPHDIQPSNAAFWPSDSLLSRVHPAAKDSLCSGRMDYGVKAGKNQFRQMAELNGQGYSKDVCRGRSLGTCIIKEGVPKQYPYRVTIVRRR